MPLEEILQKLPPENALGTLEIMEKLIGNVVRSPTEDKFRQIKLTNAKIAAAITNVPHAVDALKEMGWTETADGLSLPNSICLTQEKEMSAIIGTKQHFNKQHDAFEYQGYNGEKVRLLMQRNENNEVVNVEVFCNDECFFTGRPLLGDSTGALSCGDKALAVPERERKRLKEYLAMCPQSLPASGYKPNPASSSVAVQVVSKDAFEYQGYSGEKVRLSMQRNESNEVVNMEILVDDKAFFTGRPLLGDSTGALACGDKALAVPERERKRLKEYLATCPQNFAKQNLGSSSASVDSVSGDAFEYKDFDGETIRLVMQRNASNEITNIEVLVEGKPFWTGRPTFSDETKNMTCGDKGASAVPERDREGLKAFLARWPMPVLKLDLS